MTGKRPKMRLAAGEMETMQVLWRHGPIGLADAHQAIGRPIGYTTVQTRLNRLVAKGFVTRIAGRPAKYAATVPPEDVSARHLDLLLERVSGGSIVPLVAQLVADRSLSASEIRELKRLIKDAERRAADQPPKETGS